MKKVPSAGPVPLLTVDVPSPVTWLPAMGIQNPMLLRQEARMFHTWVAGRGVQLIDWLDPLI
jgi:hypothetical protein